MLKRAPLGAEEEKEDEGIQVEFSLPPGSYATMLLREVFRSDDVAS